MSDTPRIGRYAINAASVSAIQSHLNSVYPFEGCGMLAGSIGIDGTANILRAFGARNAEAVRGEDRFIIDPRDMKSVETKLLQTRGAERVIGFFHSHPDAPARPSSIDLEHALGVFQVTREFYVYLIASVVRGEMTDIACWQLNERLDGFDKIRRA